MTPLVGYVVPLIAGVCAPVGVTPAQALIIIALALALSLLGAAAYRWPLATTVLYLLVGPSAILLQMTSVGRPLDRVTIMGISPVSAVLFAMLGATVWRAVVLALHRRSPLPQIGNLSQ